MIRKVFLPVAALLITAGTASAQDMGGIAFPPGPIPGAAMAQAFSQVGRMPVSVSPTRRGAAPGATVTDPTVSRTARNQQLITRIRGDAGYLAGFNKGQPLAASRQAPPPPVDPSITLIEAPFIVNNFDSALNFAFGDGNVSQQQMGDGNSALATPAAPVPEAAAAKPAPKTDTAKTAPAAPALPATSPAPAASTPDALMTTAGPLTHLPFALEHGGVQFNNVNSTINMATGKQNHATQKVVTIQK